MRVIQGQNHKNEPKTVSALCATHLSVSNISGQGQGAAPQVLRIRSANPQVTLPEINFIAKLESSSEEKGIPKDSHCSKVSARLGVMAPLSQQTPGPQKWVELLARAGALAPLLA